MFRMFKRKTQLAEDEKAKFQKDIRSRIQIQKKINTKLANGITLEIGRATHK